MVSVSNHMQDEDLLKHMDQPGVRIVFAMPIGPAIMREWTWRQVFNGEAPYWIFESSPPYWLDDGETEWHHPLDPIEYRGRIKANAVERAKQWVEKPWLSR